MRLLHISETFFDLEKVVHLAALLQNYLCRVMNQSERKPCSAYDHSSNGYILISNQCSINYARRKLGNFSVYAYYRIFLHPTSWCKNPSGDTSDTLCTRFVVWTNQIHIVARSRLWADKRKSKTKDLLLTTVARLNICTLSGQNNFEYLECQPQEFLVFLMGGAIANVPNI